jgi:para-aminobenzoate synthetase / 4-amino-4-deoxychorismate lyase
MQSPSFRPPTALVRDPDADGWLAFEGVRATLAATSRADVVDIVAAAEGATRDGAWAIGFIAYEAAAAFDPALVSHPAAGAPLAWFAVCDPPRRVADADLPPAGAFSRGVLEPTLDAERHAAGVAAIRRCIERGDTYQVNFTHHLVGTFEGDPWGLFLELWRNQRAPFACWIDCGERVVCSVSPELFFDLANGRLVSRPMKGTARRGRTTDEDRERRTALARSPKDRAENVMIVDMIRNDLGRVARPGSVHTASLFDVERYESVFQLTSTVEATTDAGPAAILQALFPCASITGAPKVSTMEIIRRLEPGPRGVYTGAIGWMAPAGRARFGVAIRTAVVERRAGRLEYGTGGGIVWDSDAEAEHRECQDKARLLLAPRPAFELLETLLWEPGRGYFLLDRHLRRLADSALYFAFRLEVGAVERRLAEAAAGWTGRRRVRVTVDRDGEVGIESHEVTAASFPWRLALAAEPVDVDDPFLFHKTTHREVYDRARQGRSDVDDVLLWNRRGELTESTVANLVLKLDGGRWTPPVACGLLAGTRRQELLERGEIHERILRLDDLRRASAVYLVNSVRGWIPARQPEAGPA